MKKIAILLILVFVNISILFAQAPPQGINYQAVVYSDNGNNQPGLNVPGQVLRNKNIRVRFTIIQNLATGTEVYKEAHTATTDAFGMFSLVIGEGTPQGSSVFSNINWGAGKHFLKVEIDKNAGTNYVTMSNQQLLSVPYALYSDKSTYATSAGNGIASVSDNGNGTLTFIYIDGSTYTTPILTGLQGPQGIQGATGAQGQNGTDGINGINGANGQNGLSAYEIWLAQGNTGTESDFLNAITGAQGPQGIQGETGVGLNILNTFTSSSELPTTGNAGDAYLINGDLYVWSANTNSWTNAGNVQGPAGLNGTNGINGSNGQNGLSAYEIWLTQGNTGTESDFLTTITGAQGATGPQGSSGQNGINGANGQNGLSAYEIWLSQGNTGTQQDFITSISGPQGPVGPTGAGLSILNTFSSTSQLPTTGNPGDAYLINGELYVWSQSSNSWNNVGNVQGPAGPTGATGSQGPIGLTGPNGATGAQGIQGVAGINGTNGINGVDGKNSLAKTTTELVGANCTAGGVKIEYGLDANNNGTLDVSEVNATLTKYVCNGAVGATGAQGIQGIQGVTGPIGATGSQGPIGLTGPTGATGAQGIQGISGSQNAWSLTGSSGTAPSTNFIGTTDNQDFVFKTNNVERLRMTSNGNLGIGTNSPLAPLTVRSSSNTPNSIITDLGNSIFEGGFRLVSSKGVATNNVGDPVLNFGMIYGTLTDQNGTLIRFHRGSQGNDGAISFITSKTTDNSIIEIMRLANVNNTGRVGIGTSSPAATLDLNGSLKITNGSQGAGKVLTSDASGNATWQSPSGGGSNRVVSGTTSAGFAPSTLNGSGFTVSRVNTGNYSVTFSTPFTTTPSVNATVFLSNGSYLYEMQIVKVSGVTTNGFTVHTLNFTGGTTMNVIDYLPFSFVAVGN